MDMIGLFPGDCMGMDMQPVIHAYYFREWNGFDMPFHTHSGTEIMYVISGMCSIEIRAGEEIRLLRLSKGEFILLNAGCPHRLLVAEGQACRMLNVEFHYGQAAGSFPSLRQLAGQAESLKRLLGISSPYLVMRDPSEMYMLLKGLVLELDNGEPDSPLISGMLLVQVLIHMGRLAGRVHADTGQSEAGAYVKQAVEYMHQFYDRPIQVKHIAAAVNLHPAYLQRLFKSQTGSTLTAYLTQLRMDRAKMLLRHTDIPVAEISDYVGVASREYFSSLFKRYSGYSPADYRKGAGTQTGERKKIELETLIERHFE